MAAFQDDSARRVKDAADIVDVIGEHVVLHQAGLRFKGLCPFHSEKTPSFTVNRERQFFHCFGCKESGDVLSFMMKYHNMPFPDALSSLAERYGITLDDRDISPEEEKKIHQREALYVANETAANLFHEFLLKNTQAESARLYLEKRGLSPEIITRFKLGYAPERWDFLAGGLERAGIEQQAGIDAGLLVQNDQGRVYDRFRDRVIFPLFSLSGRFSGFGGRILNDGQPKYLNSPETAVFNKSSTLYGLYQNKEAVRAAGRCLVVEGNFDLLSLVAYGLDYAAAPLGTALTPQHIKILKRYTSEVVILFDGDEAGLKAAMRAVPLFLTEQVNAKIVVFPADHDPDTFLQAYGREAMERKIANAMDLAEFVFARLVHEHGLSLAGKGEIVAKLQPLIAAIDNQHLQKSLFVSHFSAKLGLRPQELIGGEKISAKPASVAGKNLKQFNLSAQSRQLLEFLLIYPEALPALLGAGLEEICGDDNGLFAQIIIHLKEISEGAGGYASPLVLLEKMNGEAKDFVSHVFIDAPSYSEEMKEAMVVDLSSWVRRQAWQKRKSILLGRINEAQHLGDDDLLMELLEKKKELDEVFHT